MMAIRGITWAYWQRYRTVLLTVFAVALTFATTVARLGVQKTPEYVLGPGVMLLIFGFLALIGVFIHPDADVGTGGSSYPSHMFTLPLRTSALVLWPMCLGGSLVFGFALLLAFSAQRAGVADVPLFWPPLLCVAILASLQAIFWYPLGIPYSKLLLTFAAFAFLGTAAGYASALKVPEAAICVGLGGVVALSTVIAYVGVNQARRGDFTILEFDPTSRKPGSAPSVAPFASAARAQSWYEWRLHGFVLPLIGVILFGLFCIPLVWNDTYSPLWFLGENREGYVPTIPTYAAAYLPTMLGLVVLASWVVGCGAKRTDVKRSDRTFHLFFATRPVSDGSLVSDKLWSAARSSAVTWTVVLCLTLALTRMQGGYESPHTGLVSPDKRPILEVLGPYLNLDIALKTAAVVLILAAATWRNYAIGFWTELSGKLWLRYAYPIACIFAVCIGFSIPSQSSSFGGHWLTLALVDWFVWSAVTAKLSLAAFLAFREYRSGRLAIGTIWRSLAWLGLGCGALIGIALWLSAPMREAWLDAGPITPAQLQWLLVGLVILWTPVVRLILAPMMLRLNRHRA